ncbi:hypothetical protein SASPL_141257 [Salvia splendens]|uniref:Divalent anion:Na+ symporter, DASS family n=1 Tax=Salvia splendens TaxID=180675 RepID=A0A8X8WRH6_SALSN|nr:hypothetical protein SASPL_141257 [Salvia splendens]
MLRLDLWQSNNCTSAFFLTAAAQTLLCVKLAESLGVKIADRWVTWLKIASMPVLVSVLATPAILYKIYPPEIKSTPDAPAMARQKLEQMGPIKRDEWIMIVTLVLTVSLWITGLSVLLLTGVLEWEDCLNETQAWDTVVWFGALVGIDDCSWCHTVALAATVPSLLDALSLAYNTNLFGAITHYSSGQAAVYCGGGFVDLHHVFILGITMALIQLVIWALVGAAWWKILGLY